MLIFTTKEPSITETRQVFRRSVWQILSHTDAFIQFCADTNPRRIETQQETCYSQLPVESFQHETVIEVKCVPASGG